MLLPWLRPFCSDSVRVRRLKASIRFDLKRSPLSSSRGPRFPPPLLNLPPSHLLCILLIYPTLYPCYYVVPVAPFSSLDFIKSLSGRCLCLCRCRCLCRCFSVVFVVLLCRRSLSSSHILQTVFLLCSNPTYYVLPAPPLDLHSSLATAFFYLPTPFLYPGLLCLRNSVRYGCHLVQLPHSATSSAFPSRLPIPLPHPATSSFLSNASKSLVLSCPLPTSPEYILSRIRLRISTFFFSPFPYPAFVFSRFFFFSRFFSPVSSRFFFSRFLSFLFPSFLFLLLLFLFCLFFCSSSSSSVSGFFSFRSALVPCFVQTYLRRPTFIILFRFRFGLATNRSRSSPADVGRRQYHRPSLVIIVPVATVVVSSLRCRLGGGRHKHRHGFPES